MSGALFSVEQARPDRLEQSQPGEHVWVMAVTYRLDDEVIRETKARDGVVVLNEQNIAVAASGCWLCEQEWSEKIGREPCPGEPS